MAQVRMAYTRHLLRAHAQGFPPVPTLRAFVRIAAHATLGG